MWAVGPLPSLVLVRIRVLGEGLKGELRGEVGENVGISSTLSVSKDLFNASKSDSIPSK